MELTNEKNLSGKSLGVPGRVAGFLLRAVSASESPVPEVEIGSCFVVFQAGQPALLLILLLSWFEED